MSVLYALSFTKYWQYILDIHLSILRCKSVRKGGCANIHCKWKGLESTRNSVSKMMWQEILGSILYLLFLVLDFKYSLNYEYPCIERKKEVSLLTSVNRREMKWKGKAALIINLVVGVLVCMLQFFQLHLIQFLNVAASAETTRFSPSVIWILLPLTAISNGSENGVLLFLMLQFVKCRKQEAFWVWGEVVTDWEN